MKAQILYPDKINKTKDEKITIDDNILGQFLSTF